jgi:hypothetical protein
MKKIVSMAVLGAMLLAVSLIPAITAQAATWVTEPVDAPKGPQQSAIALDSSGYPHIAYGGDGLYYAYHDGAAWNYETADSSPGAGYKLAIGLDGLDKAHIAYYDVINNQIKYATNRSGVWQSAVVDGNGNKSATIAIAVESSGKVHISYYNNPNRDFMYATNTPDSLIFTTEIIDGLDPNIDPGFGNSIDVDASGKVHIAYFYNLYVSPWYGIKYTSGNSGSWAAPQSVVTGWYEHPSIVIDSTGKAHISYFDVNNLRVSYTTNKTGVWTYEKVEGDGILVGWFSTIALYNNIPRVVYYDATNRGVRYADRDSSAWVCQTVENASYGATFASMAVDATGKAHVTYLSDTAVRYAKQTTPTSWSLVTVDTREFVGSYPSIAVDNNGYVHVSYLCVRPSYGNTGQDLKYATNASGTWQTETVETNYLNSHSIAVDATGKVHIAYIRSNEGLKYATGNLGSWNKELIHSYANNEGGFCSIGIDSAGKVHIGYFFAKSSECNLEYAVGNLGSWDKERIESKPGTNSSVGWSSSLMIEAPEDYVWIVYGYYNWDSSTYAIKMAEGRYGSWSTYDIYSGSLDYGSLDATLDDDGKTHVSFIDTAGYPKRLMYITNASLPLWEPVVADDTHSITGETSIGVDSSYHAHISYAADYVRYATNSSGSWQNETVGDPGTSSSYHDLAVDSSDAIHIAYHDSINGDLYHAYTQPAEIPVVTSLALTADPVNIPADHTSTSMLAATVKDQYGDPVADGTSVVFTTNHGTLGSSTVTKQTVGGVATATLMSESSDETIIATVTATADSVSDATAVFFIPEGGVEVTESQTETVTDSGTITDTPTGGDISIDANGDHVITAAKYADNPGGTPTFQATGDYYDVHIDDATGVNSLTIEFYPATEETKIYYWNGISWEACSDQTYADGYITVTITASTSPSLSDLSGLVFGSGVPLCIPGDANEDGVVDVIDLQVEKQIIFGELSPTCGADANVDENVSILDLVAIKLMII